MQDVQYKGADTMIPPAYSICMINLPYKLDSQTIIRVKNTWYLDKFENQPSSKVLRKLHFRVDPHWGNWMIEEKCRNAWVLLYFSAYSSVDDSYS
ncbi:hypothetical protein MGYG_03551 [Nannizzia gypsea CBS 118893]|uniref:Uncharacterized protein n=1 Tax=Arthroderma gypseum (strain ATCC MYA-4604 / CBS 118893) TaxID=535722 RepID=E4USN2_ARTGP|nr:hypothetical protein MGYG_03551 [Nannizzia gypsea CBS 118893]EFR00547.1 hypothetical protein MGYG_03551 [Nannizzia gypsea CBS 118893]